MESDVHPVTRTGTKCLCTKLQPKRTQQDKMVLQ